jgi:hypothetical protein
MSRPRNEEYSKFWFGFAVGSAVCGVVAAAMGTKQGRGMLKKTISYLEDIDGSPDQIHHLTGIIETFAKTAFENSGMNLEKIMPLEHSSDETRPGPERRSAEKATQEQTKRAEKSEREETSDKKPRVESAKVTKEAREEKAPPAQSESYTSINSIIDRMRNMTSDKKSEQRFFKPGKK